MRQFDPGGSNILTYPEAPYWGRQIGVVLLLPTVAVVGRLGAQKWTSPKCRNELRMVDLGPQRAYLAILHRFSADLAIFGSEVPAPKKVPCAAYCGSRQNDEKPENGRRPFLSQECPFGVIVDAIWAYATPAARWRRFGANRTSLPPPCCGVISALFRPVKL